MVDGWRYFAERLNGDGTATLLDPDLPISDVQIEDVLSGPGGLSGKISPEIARLKGPDGMPIFNEWSTAIYAEHDGEIRGGGILLHSGFSGPSWELECIGWTGYLKGMPYTGGGESFVKKDTLDIVRAIWAHVQGQDGGNIGLEIADDKSGVLVGSELASEQYDPEGGAGGLTLQSQAYKLQWFADFDLATNMDGLATDTPFDYATRHFWNGDVVRHRLEFGTKVGGVLQIGRRRNDLRFVLGENIFVKPEVSRDGEDYADEVYVLGAGEGALMKRGHAFTPRTRLRRVATLSNSDLKTLAQCNSAAGAELAWRRVLDDLDSVVVREHKHAAIGSMDVGDEIYVQGDTGWTEIGAWFRIVGRTISPSASGVMSLSIVRSDRLAG